jgi:hypothetical protein
VFIYFGKGSHVIVEFLHRFGKLLCKLSFQNLAVSVYEEIAQQIRAGKPVSIKGTAVIVFLTVR